MSCRFGVEEVLPPEVSLLRHLEVSQPEMPSTGLTDEFAQYSKKANAFRLGAGLDQYVSSIEANVIVIIVTIVSQRRGHSEVLAGDFASWGIGTLATILSVSASFLHSGHLGPVAFVSLTKILKCFTRSCFVVVLQCLIGYG
jgi:hypothetical protein